MSNLLDRITVAIICNIVVRFGLNIIEESNIPWEIEDNWGEAAIINILVAIKCWDAFGLLGFILNSRGLAVAGLGIIVIDQRRKAL